MGLLSHKVERSEIAAGDHIYTYRAAFTYSHHGIYVGGDTVVHSTPEQSKGSVGNSFLDFSSPVSGSSISLSASGPNASSTCPNFPRCGFQQPHSGVVLSCLDCFLGNGSLYCFEYGVATQVLLMKRGGTCTTAESDPPEVVVHRAMHLLQNGYGNYDVFKNNCEDFALFCKTGLIVADQIAPGRSGQASTVIGVPVAALLSSALKLFKSGPIGVVTAATAHYFMNRYATDIGVRKDVIKVKVESMALPQGSSVGVSKEEAPGAFDGDLSLKQNVDEEAQSLAWRNEESYQIASKKASNEVVGKDRLNEAVSEGVVLLEACNEDLQDRALRGLLDEAVEDHASKKIEQSEGGMGHEDDESKSELQSSALEEKGLSEEGSDGQEDVGDYNQNETDENGLVSVSLNGKYGSQHYPLRPDAIDCPYYMRTGMCKFGSNCKFNHPSRRLNQAFKDKVKQKDDNLERPGPTECKYYLTSVGCKYGKACRYDHCGGKPSAAPILEYTFLGLPIRPGEKECPCYMYNGFCKYGSNCRFDHPAPAAVGANDYPSGYGNEGSISTMNSWSSSRTLNEPAPYVPVMFPPTQGMPSRTPEWNGYQASRDMVKQKEDNLKRPGPTEYKASKDKVKQNEDNLDRLGQTECEASMVKVKPKEDNLERPGPTECKYSLTSVGCKYGKACRYDHHGGMPSVAPILEYNFLGLPIRPGRRECSYYMRNGCCKYGSNCRFNHPDPAAVGATDHPSGYGNEGSISTMNSWSSSRILNETAPYVPVMFPPTQGMPSPTTEWNGYQDG